MRSIERRMQQLETKRSDDGEQVTAIIRQIVSRDGEWAPTWAACGWGTEEMRIARGPGESADAFEERVVSESSAMNNGIPRIRMGCGLIAAACQSWPTDYGTPP